MQNKYGLRSECTYDDLEAEFLVFKTATRKSPARDSKRMNRGSKQNSHPDMLFSDILSHIAARIFLVRDSSIHSSLSVCLSLSLRNHATNVQFFTRIRATSR